MTKLKVYIASENTGLKGNYSTAYIVTKDGEYYTQGTGTTKDTTSPGADILSAKQALAWIQANAGKEEVIFLTTSEYIFNGFTQWLPTWRKNGWNTGDKKPIENRALWQRSSEILSKIKAPQFKLIKGDNEWIARVKFLCRNLPEKSI